MWFIFALIAGIFFALNSLVVRLYVKKNKDSWAMSFFFSAMCAAILLPFFIYEFEFTNTWYFWGTLLILSVIIVIHNAMSFKASSLLGASTQNTLYKLRLLWLVIMGVIVFNEVLTLKTIAGMVLIVAAALMIIDYGKWKVSRKGIILVLLCTITGMLLAVLTKKIVGMSGVLTLTFLVFFIPAIFNAAAMPNFVKRAKKEFSNIKLMLIIGVLAVIANLALIKALSYDVLSGVYFVIDAGLIVILFGERLFLKEKERLPWKIAAVILAIAGAVLIHGM
ncbi:MAG: EamA family transporter [Candidatus Nanoarchaeia archaeon]